MRSRRNGRLAVAAGVLGLAAMTVVSGCAPVTNDVADASAVSLERFYSQQLTWEECDDYATTDGDAEVLAVVGVARCARLAVPLDYEEPDGPEAAVAVLRIPARGEALGSLVTNPGGPGRSGVIGAVAAAGGLVRSSITERFDVVGFDPRGVGATVPAVDCYSDADADTGSVALGPSGTTESLTSDRVRELVERCAEGSGGPDALAHMGTRDTARDMDVLRAALGDDRLTFLGQSYGTRLGAVYAEQFPGNVRAMILDSGMDPDHGTMETRLASYAGFQTAFDDLAAACAAQPGCPLGQDPARATAEFQRIVRPLVATPVPALGTELDFDAAVGGVIAGLYAPDQWSRVIAGIGEVEQGRGDELLRLIHDFGGRTASGQWPNADEANYAVNCMDEERLTPEQGAELREATFARAPFMDPGTAVTPESHDGCAHWPAEPNLGFPYAQGVEGLAPTLAIGMTDDPATPYEGTVNLARTLGSSMLTVQGQGHTVVGGGRSACVDEIAAAYLIDLELPAAGATCTMG